MFVVTCIVTLCAMTITYVGDLAQFPQRHESGAHSAIVAKLLCIVVYDGWFAAPVLAGNWR